MREKSNRVMRQDRSCTELRHVKAVKGRTYIGVKKCLRLSLSSLGLAHPQISVHTLFTFKHFHTFSHTHFSPPPSLDIIQS